MSVVRKLLVTTLACASVLVIPAVTRAQVDGVHLTLFPGTLRRFSNDTNFEDEPLWGGTAGLGLGRYLAIEGHLGRTTTQTLHGFTHHAIGFPPAPPPREVTVLPRRCGVGEPPARPSSRAVCDRGLGEAKFDFADEDSVPGPSTRTAGSSEPDSSSASILASDSPKSGTTSGTSPTARPSLPERTPSTTSSTPVVSSSRLAVWVAATTTRTRFRMPRTSARTRRSEQRSMPTAVLSTPTATEFPMASISAPTQSRERPWIRAAVRRTRMATASRMASTNARTRPADLPSMRAAVRGTRTAMVCRMERISARTLPPAWQWTPGDVRRTRQRRRAGR